jgi:hypothetical protein
MAGGPAAPCTTAIGILSKLFLGRRPAEMAGGIAYLAARPPAWDPRLGRGGVRRNRYFPMYYVYYGTLALHLTGGEPWRKWNEAMKRMLLPRQREKGPHRGSWDPIRGADDRIGGRVYMTAMAALCLEAYYRYLPMCR